MLKIKDDVDLNLLMKEYGFEPNTIVDNKVYNLRNKDTFVELYDEITRKDNTRLIFASGSAYLDTIYDLIKADLVEKVGD